MAARQAVATPQESELDHGDDEEVLDPAGEGEEHEEVRQDDPSGQDAEGEDEQEDDLLDPSDRVEQVAGRAVTRIQRLSNENRDLRDRLQGLERRLQSGGPALAAQTQQEETEEQFRARLALLNPDDRMMAMFERSERRNQRVLQMQSLQHQDTTDRVSYQAKAASDPRYKRYENEVENLRTELLQTQGQLVPRQVLLELLIGRKVLANSGSTQVRKQKQQGRANVQRQQTRPAGSRSDVQGNRREVNEREARAKRLDGMRI